MRPPWKCIRSARAPVGTCLYACWALNPPNTRSAHALRVLCALDAPPLYVERAANVISIAYQGPPIHTRCMYSTMDPPSFWAHNGQLFVSKSHVDHVGWMKGPTSSKKFASSGQLHKAADLQLQVKAGVFSFGLPA